MKPVTFYRNPLWRGDNPLQGAEAVEWKALLASDFDALVRERDEARALLREALPWIPDGAILPEAHETLDLRARIDTALREALAAGGK